MYKRQEYDDNSERVYDYVHGKRTDLMISGYHNSCLLYTSHPVLISEERVKLLKEYVEQGGTLVIGCRSGYKDMNGKCVMLPQPGLLAELTGTDVRDFTFTSPAEDEVFAEFSDKKIPMPVFNDIITPLEGTKTLAIYGNSYYEGNPALTCHAVGKGQVLHLGATFNKENTEALFDYLKIKEPFKEYIEAPETAEVIMREKDGEKYLSLIHILCNLCISPYLL